ncbi:MAG: hypothetical protein A3F68_06310 [Acidobacteria bacterium RIFCSPLOWO2_12_FULL_54_10]|nr:MAG: hypothetical protein A3F68_06310 [Acidobacteria bacterium RIFCSPLOWO2_12_FULL_54_10]
MKCHEMENYAIAYLDEKLSSREQAAVQQHLERCGACASRLKSFSEISNMLSEWEDIQPSNAFHVQLDRKILESAPNNWWQRYWSQIMPLSAPGPVFASLAVSFFLIAVLVMRYTPSTEDIFTGQQAQLSNIANTAGVDELALYENLSLLEDWEVVSNFEVLQEMKR